MDPRPFFFTFSKKQTLENIVFLPIFAIFQRKHNMFTKFGSFLPVSANTDTESFPRFLSFQNLTKKRRKQRVSYLPTLVVLACYPKQTTLFCWP